MNDLGFDKMNSLCHLCDLGSIIFFTTQNAEEHRGNIAEWELPLFHFNDLGFDKMNSLCHLCDLGGKTFFEPQRTQRSIEEKLTGYSDNKLLLL